MEKIEIITGIIKVGKTTYLQNRITTKTNIKGILQPVLESERYFKDLESGEKRQITTKTSSEGTFTIGKYLFNFSAFEWAKEKLGSILNEGFDTIVIDEYGPLEFENKGLEPEVSTIISVILKSSNQKLIIAVRESLVEKFIQKFNLLTGDYKRTKITRME
jgi:nucleoside-triphosphatase THEP1